MESAICTFFFSGYALDPSLDNHQVSTKYIGSVEEAEKTKEYLFEMLISNIHNYMYFVSWLWKVGEK